MLTTEALACYHFAYYLYYHETQAMLPYLLLIEEFLVRLVFVERVVKSRRHTFVLVYSLNPPSSGLFYRLYQSIPSSSVRVIL